MKTKEYLGEGLLYSKVSLEEFFEDIQKIYSGQCISCKSNLCPDHFGQSVEELYNNDLLVLTIPVVDYNAGGIVHKRIYFCSRKCFNDFREKFEDFLKYLGHLREI